VSDFLYLKHLARPELFGRVCPYPTDFAHSAPIEQKMTPGHWICADRWPAQAW